MEYEVVVTVPALLHLEEIHSYISQFNPRGAEKTLAKIESRLDLLRSFPFLGAAYPDAQSAFRQIISGKYRIFYRVDENKKQVRVLAVWHSARQDPNLPLD